MEELKETKILNIQSIKVNENENRLYSRKEALKIGGYIAIRSSNI
jgi:hypothetical protein